MTNILRNSRGSSLVQSIIALAILMMATFVFVGALQAIQMHSKGTMVMNSSQREVTEIIENIRTGVESYQVDFTPRQELEDALDPKNLSMAWDVGIQTTAEACPTCAGRFGYVIQPFEGYRGLYLVTVRLTHANWKDEVKEYQFTVTTK